MQNQEKLSDILRPNLKLVICGTAAGNKSAELGTYYAGTNNMFWEILNTTGLTPRQLRPDEYEKLLEYGIGLTDIAKKASGMDADIPDAEYDVEAFYEKMKKYEPKTICFNGKKAASVFLSWRLQKKLKTSQIKYGCFLKEVDKFNIFLAPSTSSAARKYWNAEWWQELAGLIKYN